MKIDFKSSEPEIIRLEPLSESKTALHPLAVTSLFTTSMRVICILS